MPDNKIAAALLTFTLNYNKPRIADPQQMGEQDWELIVEEYRQILDALDKQK